MVHEAAPLIGIDEESLLDELQAVHRRHGDSEHPFSLLETSAVREKFSGKTHDDLAKSFDPAFHAFNRVRKQNLKLYNGVYETLERLERIRIPVVAYTDARVINCSFRVNQLGIKHLIARLYAPAHLAKDLDRSVSSDDFVRLLSEKDRKPNPQTLIDICSEFSIEPSASLYIGDSLVRDIYMAKGAGLHSAWARFGTLYDKVLWPQLVRVTHWTDADVERERKLKEDARGIEPDCVLDNFADIFQHFEFKSAVIAKAAS
jgi:phosphoglycolate phosphatase